MSRLFLIVHGAVQGVGYRHFVWRTASGLGIRGFVRNADDGSVEVLADADSERLKRFMQEINVDFQNGPQVFKIDIDNEALKKFEKKKLEGFVIEG